jgi:hypothetical protein
MNHIAERLSNAVQEGVIYDYSNDHISLYIKEIQHEFIQIQMRNPPREEIQLEAFGGTLYRTVLGFRNGFSGMNVEEWKFITELCIKHVNVQYLVVCVLQITSICIRAHMNRNDTRAILPMMESMAIFFMVYHETNKTVYWSLDIVDLWMSLFRASNEIRDKFCNEIKYMEILLIILTFPARGDIVPFRPDIRRHPPRAIFVRTCLPRINGYYFNELCFHFAYASLFMANIPFRESAARFWGFIILENHKLVDIETIKHGILEMQRQQNITKSARKHVYKHIS